MKKYESFVQGVEDSEFIDKLMKMNPLYKTHNLFAFIYDEDFIKIENSDSYKKTIKIEKIIKIDKNNFKLLYGMNMRAIVTRQNIAFLWFPKDSTDLIEYKGSNEMEQWLIDLIEKHMLTKSDKQSKDIFNDLKNRLTSLNNFNI